MLTHTRATLDSSRVAIHCERLPQEGIAALLVAALPTRALVVWRGAVSRALAVAQLGCDRRCYNLGWRCLFGLGSNAAVRLVVISWSQVRWPCASPFRMLPQRVCAPMCFSHCLG